jgi:hypothetical protein
MRAYEASASIDAPPDRIWAILTDGGGYSTSDSGVDRVEGFEQFVAGLKQRAEGR